MSCLSLYGEARYSQDKYPDLWLQTRALRQQHTVCIHRGQPCWFPGDCLIDMVFPICRKISPCGCHRWICRSKCSSPPLLWEAARRSGRFVE